LDKIFLIEVVVLSSLADTSADTFDIPLFKLTTNPTEAQKNT